MLEVVFYKGLMCLFFKNRLRLGNFSQMSRIREKNNKKVRILTFFFVHSIYCVSGGKYGSCYFLESSNVYVNLFQ